MKQIILLLAVALFLAPWAKAQDTGIQFEQKLNWPEVLQKAKAENKYIFMDCYASWCGPCKFMDANVYPVKAAGDYYNAHFICVRVQMDETAMDDQRAKDWHGVAKYIQRTFAVFSYPTFLFFDPAGQAVHKLTGTKTVDGLIAMGADAQDPDKQYYTLVKNFQPGRIDTAELKSLARLFHGSDKQLAGRMAIDYLSRQPDQALAAKDNRKFMTEFQGDSAVLQFATRYLQREPKDSVLDFMTGFRKQHAVRVIAKDYLQQLTSRQIYSNKSVILLAETFSDTVTDRAFGVFYKNAAKIDGTMGQRDIAEGFVAGLILKAEFGPLETVARETLVTPDFDKVSKAVTRKYGKAYAERVVIVAKMNWYDYLARTRKLDKYWPDYFTARVAQITRFRYDTIAGLGLFMNNFSFSEVFRYCDNPAQLEAAAGWMKELTDRNPKGYNEMDTYACILYKAGHTDEAIRTEERALDLARDNKSEHDITYSEGVIEKMRKGERFWEEKEYFQ